MTLDFKNPARQQEKAVTTNFVVLKSLSQPRICHGVFQKIAKDFLEKGLYPKRSEFFVRHRRTKTNGVKGDRPVVAGPGLEPGIRLRRIMSPRDFCF